MKYTITIEHGPGDEYPYVAFWKKPDGGYLANSGKTPKKAEVGLIAEIKRYNLWPVTQPTITKEIEIP